MFLYPILNLTDGCSANQPIGRTPEVRRDVASGRIARTTYRAGLNKPGFPIWVEPETAPYANIAPPPCLPRGGFFSICFVRPMLGTASRFPSSRFSTANAGSAQTFSTGNLVFRSLIRPRVTSFDQRRRNRQPCNSVEDRGEQVPRHRHFGQLKCDVFRVPGDLGSDLDQFLAERRQRPMRDILRQCKSS